MKVIYCVPGFEPVVMEVENSLSELQKLVGGYIECINPWEEPIAIIVNEEGKLIGLPANKKLYDDILVGNLVIVGIDEECNFCSIPEDLIGICLERINECEIY